MQNKLSLGGRVDFPVLSLQGRFGTPPQQQHPRAAHTSQLHIAPLSGPGAFTFTLRRTSPSSHSRSHPQPHMWKQNQIRARRGREKRQRRSSVSSVAASDVSGE